MNFSGFQFRVPSISSKKQQKPKPLQQDIKSVLGDSMTQMTNVGVGLATKFPTHSALSVFQRTAKSVGTQPFNLSGSRRAKAKPPQPGEKFKMKAQQISHQPFAISGSRQQQQQQVAAQAAASHENLFVRKAHQVANQPFKLYVQPPSPTKSPADIFLAKAKQVAHQPFALGSGGKKAAVTGTPTTQQDINLFKKKARSIGFLASQTLFHKVIEEQIDKVGRFKSTAQAVLKTQRMFKNITHYDETRGSNEVEIKKGIYPMLKREILEVLFQYMSVPELKKARLVCDFWKRFASIELQQKSIVRLSGICPICRSEYMSHDPNIQPHDHAHTIAFYRFLLFIQEYPENKRYPLPFRNFKISKVNLYFIRGLNTEPTRAFLMFLKLWADKVHELKLKSVQMSPPDSFYRIIDTCSRLRKVTLDDVRVWLDPLNGLDNSQPFKMKINYYVTTITFCTNWIGEELLHWQMILEAFPCLQEINMIDVSKMEINHFLTAVLNLPEEEEVEEVRKTKGFKKLSRRILFFKVGGRKDDEPEDEESRAPSPRLHLNMPFSLYLLHRLQQVKSDGEGGRFKKMAQTVSIQGVTEVPEEVPVPEEPVAGPTPVSFRSRVKQMTGHPFRVPQPIPEPESGIKFKKLARKIGNIPFKLGALTPEAEEMIKAEGGQAFKKMVGKMTHQPFKLKSAPDVKPEGSGGDTAAVGGEPPPVEGTQEGTEAQKSEGSKDPSGTERSDADEPVGARKSKSRGKFKKKAKSYVNQPFKMVGPPVEVKEAPKEPKTFRSKARAIINQPFTLVNPEPEVKPEVFIPKTFKSQIKKIIHQPFQVKKPSPLLKFKLAAKNIANQPFNLGQPKAHEKVLAGSALCRINIATRRNFEDQLKIDLAANENFSDDDESGSDSDDSSTDSIKEKDFSEFDTNELLAEVVSRFDITNLSLRVHYTSDDCSSFPNVLEACREKLRVLALTRPSKVYFSEIDLQFRSSPFETPEETLMEFPHVKRLAIAHNFVDSIDEISSSFPALQKLTINIVPTEFLVPKKKPYKSYVKTNLMITMRSGKPMPNIKTLEWNITEARHPYTLKRTVVYKSNALRYAPRIFPNISKLVVSITTAHELHVIFRHCTQLHDLVVLKNSFYRTKDADIIGDPDDPDPEGSDPEEEEAAREARLAKMVHPTKLKNGGIKQLLYLRRLALQNNNCCLTNRSIQEGFIHLRRLRSLHISLAKRISVRTIRLLKRCRFLVHVRITKDKLRMRQPPPPEPDESQELQAPTPNVPPGYPPFCVPESSIPSHPKLGFEPGTKYDKIGGKRFVILKTTYEVNGRTYELIRKQYECRDDRDSQVWEGRFRHAERRRKLEEERQRMQEKWKETEIDGVKLVRRAERKILLEKMDEESDYERFIIDYDEDEDEDEEGYCDEEDDLLMEEVQIPEEEESSDEEGICLEADTMYEGDKETYLDTETKSSDDDDDESYCDSPSDPEYQADRETNDVSDENQGGEKSGEKRETAEPDVEQIPSEEPAEMKPEEDQPENQEPPPVETPPPSLPPDDVEQEQHDQEEQKPKSGKSRRENIMEMLNFKREKSKSKKKSKRGKEKKKRPNKVHPMHQTEYNQVSKVGSSTTSSTTTTSVTRPSSHTTSTETYRRNGAADYYYFPGVEDYVARSQSASYIRGQAGRAMAVTDTSSTSNSVLTNERVGIEYREFMRMRRMSASSSLSSHGPSHFSTGHGTHGLLHLDPHDSTDGGESQRSSREKHKKKDKEKHSSRSNRSKSSSKPRKEGKKDKKRRTKSADGKRRKDKSPAGVNDDDLRRAGSVSPSQMQLLGDLRQQLIQKMVQDVRKELKK